MVYIHPDKEGNVILYLVENWSNNVDTWVSALWCSSIIYLLNSNKNNNKWTRHVGEAIILANISEVLNYTKYLKVL